MFVIPVPGTKVETAFTCSLSGGVPACASPCERAIEKHEACAAAISSSGLVRPCSSGSEREAHVMSSPSIAPLPVKSILPVPFRRFPLQVTSARRSAAIHSSLGHDFDTRRLGQRNLFTIEHLAQRADRALDLVE